MNSLKKLTSNPVFRNWSKAVLGLNIPKSYTRNLYSPAGMGIDSYIGIRERTLTQFASSEDKFKAKMAEYADMNSKHMIFTEDLKSMVHLADNDEDVKTLMFMLRKFNQQNKELRFGSFIFGPVIMRMFYFLQKPKEALEAFKDENLAGMFDQLISYQILMDLLFTTENYNDVLEVFQIVKDKQLQPNRYPKNVVTLFLGACYKINTAESFQLASEIWTELKTYGHNPMRRAITFLAFLAIKQGAPHVALEVLSNEKQQNYITIRNLKAWALSELGRPDDVVPILRSVLNSEDPSGRKHTFCQEVIEAVKLGMERCSEKETVAEFERVEKQLRAHQLILPSRVDEFLCQDIMMTQNSRDAPQRSQLLAGSYNRRSVVGSGGGSRYKQRPGLADMA